MFNNNFTFKISEWIVLSFDIRKKIIKLYIESEEIKKDYPFAIKWPISLYDKLLYEPIDGDVENICSFINKSSEVKKILYYFL